MSFSFGAAPSSTPPVESSGDNFRTPVAPFSGFNFGSAASAKNLNDPSDASSGGFCFGSSTSARDIDRSTTRANSSAGANVPFNGFNCFGTPPTSDSISSFHKHKHKHIVDEFNFRDNNNSFSKSTPATKDVSEKKIIINVKKNDVPSEIIINFNKEINKKVIININNDELSEKQSDDVIETSTKQNDETTKTQKRATQNDETTKKQKRATQNDGTTKKQKRATQNSNILYESDESDEIYNPVKNYIERKRKENKK